MAGWFASKTASTVATLLCFIALVAANTEKAIFLGPTAIAAPDALASARRQLDVLSHHDRTLRTRLSAAFPTNEAPQGVDSWFWLDGLREGQRYEVRVCWAAIQPTAFDVRVHELAAVVASTTLSSSLEAYMARLSARAAADPLGEAPLPSSALLLRVSAAAEYYSADAELMRSVPPVLVDVILDPFVGNVLPASLVPTVAYVVVLVALSWVVAGMVSKWLQKTAQGEDEREKKD